MKKYKSNLLFIFIIILMQNKLLCSHKYFGLNICNYVISAAADSKEKLPTFFPLYHYLQTFFFFTIGCLIINDNIEG